MATADDVRVANIKLLKKLKQTHVKKTKN